MKRGPCLTCYCSAYRFPHRLGGGRCDASEWAASYFLLIKKECRHCNNNHQGTCQVAEGLESISTCEAYHEELRNGDPVRLPTTEEDYINGNN